jgi:hypothetical protein
MPQLDFMVVADYVRADAGVLNMVGAGFDTVYLPVVPGVLPAGIGLRIFLDVAEAREQHPFTVIFQNADGARLAEVSGVVGPVPADATEPQPMVRVEVHGVSSTRWESRGLHHTR